LAFAYVARGGLNLLGRGIVHQERVTFYLSWKAKESDFAMRFIELASWTNDAMRAMELLHQRENSAGCLAT
jgi:hypothetical protein